MGRLFLISLEGKIYSCKHCQAHLAVSDDIVSKVRQNLPSHATTEAFFLGSLRFLRELRSCLFSACSKSYLFLILISSLL
ncbi:hypothetical protein GW17_00031392 [Ensete ventricosum]|nr:hypothetical protein GW17_00031392 [Ensete ventricosum]